MSEREYDLLDYFKNALDEIEGGSTNIFLLKQDLERIIEWKTERDTFKGQLEHRELVDPVIVKHWKDRAESAEVDAGKWRRFRESFREHKCKYGAVCSEKIDVDSRLAEAEKTWLEIKQPLERIIKRTCPCYGMITSLKDLSYCGECQFIPLRWNKDGIDKFKELETALRGTKGGDEK